MATTDSPFDMPQALTVRQEPRVASGALTLGNLDVAQLTALYKVTSIFFASGLLPSHIKSKEAAFTIAMMGNDLGLPFLVALNHMFVIHGKIGCEAKLMLAQMEHSGLIEEYSLTTAPTEATCRIKRRGRQAQTATITRAMAEQAGWCYEWKDKDGQKVKTVKHTWQAMPDVMLGWRAVARVARTTFADVILGLYTFDEMDVPEKIDEQTGEVVLDPSRAVEMAPAAVEEQKPEKVELASRPTQAQGLALTQLLQEKYPDGTPVFLPSEKRKRSEYLAANNSEKGYAACLESWTAEVRVRFDAWQAKADAKQEQAASGVES